MDTVFCEDIVPEKTLLQSAVCTDSVLIDSDGFLINELKLDFRDSPGPNFYEVELAGTIGTWFMKNSDPIISFHWCCLTLITEHEFSDRCSMEKPACKNLLATQPDGR